MRFVFAYVGLTSGDVFDYIQKMQPTLTGGKDDKTEVLLFAHGAVGPQGAPYGRRHTAKVLARLKTLAERDKDDDSGVSKTGYAVIYVRSDPASSAWLEQAFFPATLTVPVDWQQTGETPDERSESHKQLFGLLLDASIRARNAIAVVHKELLEQSNKTPFLLPLRNFHSNALQGALKGLQSRIILETEQPSAHDILKAVAAEFEFRHPRNPAPRSQLRTFRDDRDIEFRAPGKAKHGVPDFGTEHPTEACILGGFRRLGAPFHAGFHYDAQKDSPKNLKGRFCMCHGEIGPMEGDPHLNIAPNDFTRI